MASPTERYNVAWNYLQTLLQFARDQQSQHAFSEDAFQAVDVLSKTIDQLNIDWYKAITGVSLDAQDNVADEAEADARSAREFFTDPSAGVNFPDAQVPPLPQFLARDQRPPAIPGWSPQGPLGFPFGPYPGWPLLPPPPWWYPHHRHHHHKHKHEHRKATKVTFAQVPDVSQLAALIQLGGQCGKTAAPPATPTTALPAPSPFNLFGLIPQGALPQTTQPGPGQLPGMPPQLFTLPAPLPEGAPLPGVESLPFPLTPPYIPDGSGTQFPGLPDLGSLPPFLSGLGGGGGLLGGGLTSAPMPLAPTSGATGGTVPQLTAEEARLLATYARLPEQANKDYGDQTSNPDRAGLVRDTWSWWDPFAAYALPSLYAADRPAAVAVVTSHGVSESGWHWPGVLHNPMGTQLQRPGAIQKVGDVASGRWSWLYATTAQGLMACLDTYELPGRAPVRSSTDPGAIIRFLTTDQPSGQKAWGTDQATWLRVYGELYALVLQTLAGTPPVVVPVS